MGVWDPDGLVRSTEEVSDLNVDADPVLYAHGNYLNESISLPQTSTIVYCPRTHAAFGHPPHPFQKLLAAGVRVALGTDSLASNPDLDVLAEARFLHRRHPEVPGATLLCLATLWGAEALGWGDHCGSLVKGKSADLVILPLPSTEPPDAHDLIFDSSLRVAKVLQRGRWCEVHHSPEVVS
jgi:cytosine/adenosine deaminase-related metal-dependent hydrolase